MELTALKPGIDGVVEGERGGLGDSPSSSQASRSTQEISDVIDFGGRGELLSSFVIVAYREWNASPKGAHEEQSGNRISAKNLFKPSHKVSKTRLRGH